MIVLDTNVVSELMRVDPDGRVLTWITTTEERVAITAVTLAELLAGLRRLPDGRRKIAFRDRVDAVVSEYRGSGAVLAFDEDAAGEYAEILAMRERTGLPIATADAQIAAICAAQGAICATRNTRDFTGTGVEVFDPWSGEFALS
ncbi:VapC toxin family PIN domain ribonuclease [Leucobacter sp. OLJS4]|uniref:type II toxin-antitoxin system VapC family toxin n=1 Tax=unclassified Leucobacter TaxID=2621730 RepID=UPI000C18118B|nr:MULTISPECIES: type II toxin-antitoxin system VapC family toxin [unclassified Leucobacter]PIJ55580.1 VapC toxin family PIN domain ribonuclease [Leucobacter sp. OLES1]PII84449.1 VapC toxin family PIN domain ribonuclease [Leucobacter sp. OLCALW19]PII88686.1 VapC toxin family PIN domain ribonuclease [Leucobacter sp. OLTLW20]PII90956.1 VapC toxin family PIN domain ribonuclease [Leucobacter sp. OLAS13]PII97703.1 VapC toxin family PIN domain ribonuclease [Leucobacter sp. OLDS2]